MSTDCVKPPEVFRHCPRCAVAVTATGQNPFSCPTCGLTYFFNPTVSAAAFLTRPDGQILFIRREHEPAKGMLAIPGGFVDFGERAEESLRREIREEVGLEIADLRFLGSWVNSYPYRGVLYSVVDLVFTATAMNPERAEALDAVAGLEWRSPHAVNAEDLAFPSMQSAWLTWQGQSGGPR